MDYSNITLMKMMQVKMGYLSERQDVLSANIANIDTPGYKARDLKELDFKRLALIESNRLQMRTSSPSHQKSPEHLHEDFRNQKSRKTYETTPVENNIVLEEQMAKINDTNADHQLVTNLYRKTGDMFRNALGNR